MNISLDNLDLNNGLDIKYNVLSLIVIQSIVLKKPSLFYADARKPVLKRTRELRIRSFVLKSLNYSIKTMVFQYRISVYRSRFT